MSIARTKYHRINRANRRESASLTWEQTARRDKSRSYTLHTIQIRLYGAIVHEQSCADRAHAVDLVDQAVAEFNKHRGKFRCHENKTGYDIVLVDRPTIVGRIILTTL